VAQAVLLHRLAATLSILLQVHQPITLNMNISPALAQALLNYLASKPYAEVFELIHAMQVASKEGNAPSDVTEKD
jgi:hypothetical protein